MSASPEKKVNVALIGANGMLAKMVRKQAPRNHVFHNFDLPEFDMTDRALVLESMARLKPEVIINCAAYTNVDGAENERDLAMLVNGTSVGYLAEAALDVDAILVHISTDYVFDGTKSGLYNETDEPNPQSVYGRSKLLGEQSVKACGLTKYFIIRTSWLYGPGGNNFVETIVRLAAGREELNVIDDQLGCPTYTADLADAMFNLLEQGQSSCEDSPYGIYHFADDGACSWYEFACAIVEEARIHHLPVKVTRINPITTADYPLPARRPANSLFDKAKYKAATKADVPAWRESLAAYFTVRAQ